jgi:thiamine transport system substrate-binding protein
VNRHPRHLAVLLAAALLLSACADDDQPTSDEGTDATRHHRRRADADGRATRPPSRPSEVTLLTHDSFDVSEDVLASFTADTGIEVTVVPLGDAGHRTQPGDPHPGRAAGRPALRVDTTFLSRALDAELFLPYESPMLDRGRRALQLDPELRAPRSTSATCASTTTSPGSRTATSPCPTDLADLTDPAYAGLLAVQNPATSSPGLAFLLATIDRFGEDGYLDFWEDLVDNDVVVTDGWSEAYYDEFSGHRRRRPAAGGLYASSPPPRCSSPTRSPTRRRPG